MARGLLGATTTCRCATNGRPSETDFVLRQRYTTSRLDYGNHIRGSAVYGHLSITQPRQSQQNLEAGHRDLIWCCCASLALQRAELSRWAGWLEQLRNRERPAQRKISQQAHNQTTVSRCTCSPELDRADWRQDDPGSFGGWRRRRHLLSSSRPARFDSSTRIRQHAGRWQEFALGQSERPDADIGSSTATGRPATA